MRVARVAVVLLGVVVGIVVISASVAVAGKTEIVYDQMTYGTGFNAYWAAYGMDADPDGHLVVTGNRRAPNYRMMHRMTFDPTDMSYTGQVITRTQNSGWSGSEGRFYDASSKNTTVHTFDDGGAGSAGGARNGDGVSFYGGDPLDTSPSMFMLYNGDQDNSAIIELQPQDANGDYDWNSKNGAALSTFSVPTSATGGNNLRTLRVHGTPGGNDAARLWGCEGGNVYSFDVGPRTGLIVDHATPQYVVGTRTVTTPSALTLLNEGGTDITGSTSDGTIVSLDFDVDDDLWVLRAVTRGNWFIEEYLNQGGDTWKREQRLHCLDTTFIPADQFLGGGTGVRGDDINELAWLDDVTLEVVESYGWSGNAAHLQMFQFKGELEVVPIPEPTGLGLIGMALLALKRRRS